MSDTAQLRLIIAQCETQIATLTSGQTADREKRIAELRQTIDWAERRLAGDEPFEERSQIVT